MAEPATLLRRTTDSDDGEIAYFVAGNEHRGVPIVLLPGFQSDSTSWVRSGYLPLLSDRRVLLVDVLGHGESAKPHDESCYSAQRTVDQIRAVLDDEGIEQAIIWGFSRGGIIAALCGELMPERCHAVVMGGAPLGRATAVTHPPLDAGEPLLAAGDWAGWWANFPVPIPQWMQDAFAEANDPEALAAALRGMRSWAAATQGRELEPRVATLSYWGTGEVFADLLRDELAGTAVVTHEGDWAGHAETMMDAAGVVAVVSAFLEQHAP